MSEREDSKSLGSIMSDRCTGIRSNVRFYYSKVYSERHT
jgi:hypothetical protein